MEEFAIIVSGSNLNAVKFSIDSGSDVTVSNDVPIFKTQIDESESEFFSSVGVLNNEEILGGAKGPIRRVPFFTNIYDPEFESVEVDESKSILAHKDRVLWIEQWDDRSIITASSDHSIKFWDIESGKILKDDMGHNDVVYCCPKVSSHSFCSSSNDRMIMVWDLEKGLISKFVGHSGFVFGCDYSREDDILFSGGSDYCWKMWDLRIKADQQTPVHSGKCVRSIYSCLCVSSLHKYFFGCSSGFIGVVDTRMPSEKLEEFKICGEWVNRMRMFGNGKYLCSCSDDGSFQICSIEESALKVLKKYGKYDRATDIRVMDHKVSDRKMMMEDEKERLFFITHELEIVQGMGITIKVSDGLNSTMSFHTHKILLFSHNSD